jgi:hypothetical protein
MKNNYLGINIGIVIGMIILFGSCQWVTIDLPEVSIPQDKVVSFSAEIQPIFEAKCVDCHGVSSPPNGVDLTSEHAYNTIQTKELADTVNPEASIIYVHPSPTGTHFSKYSNEQAAYVLKWIEQGAKNN